MEMKVESDVVSCALRAGWLQLSGYKIFSIIGYRIGPTSMVSFTIHIKPKTKSASLEIRRQELAV